ncbi:MAG: hypothetical protein HYV63_22375 [Candidatus Schekmanbacteria bacterium]|nr:hypothetical protein [Candidatus Schekmanbacteria bacterium]
MNDLAAPKHRASAASGAPEPPLRSWPAPALLFAILALLVVKWGASSYYIADDYHHLLEARAHPNLLDLIAFRYRTWSPRWAESLLIWLTSFVSPDPATLGHDAYGMVVAGVFVAGVLALAAWLAAAFAAGPASAFWVGSLLLAGFLASGLVGETVFWQSATYPYLFALMAFAGSLYLLKPGTGGTPGGRRLRVAGGTVLFLLALGLNEFFPFVLGPLLIAALWLWYRHERLPAAGLTALLVSSNVLTLAVYLTAPGGRARLATGTVRVDWGAGEYLRSTLQMLEYWLAASLHYVAMALPFGLVAAACLLARRKGDARRGRALLTGALLLAGASASILFFLTIQLVAKVNAFTVGPGRVEFLYYSLTLPAVVLLCVGAADVLARWKTDWPDRLLRTYAGGTVLHAAAVLQIGLGLAWAIEGVVYSGSVRQQLAERFDGVRREVERRRVIGNTKGEAPDAPLIAPPIVVPEPARMGMLSAADLEPDPAWTVNVFYAEYLQNRLRLASQPQVRVRRFYEGYSIGERIANQYREILGREPDLSGYTYFVHRAAHGETDLTGVRVSLLSSAELRTMIEQGRIKSPRIRREADIVAAISSLYRDTLFRSPDEGGLGRYFRHVVSGAMTMEDVARAMRDSLEYHRRRERSVVN